jgi:hypothetical protein
MSKTKGAIMDIIDWYGYIPDGYTFKDYNKELQQRQAHAQEQNQAAQNSQAISRESAGHTNSEED